MEGYRSGHNGADSKSVWAQAHKGSNPFPSAKTNPVEIRRDFLFRPGISQPVGKHIG